MGDVNVKGDRDYGRQTVGFQEIRWCRVACSSQESVAITITRCLREVIYIRVGRRRPIPLMLYNPMESGRRSWANPILLALGVSAVGGLENQESKTSSILLTGLARLVPGVWALVHDAPVVTTAGVISGHDTPYPPECRPRPGPLIATVVVTPIICPLLSPVREPRIDLVVWRVKSCCPGHTLQQIHPTLGPNPSS